jgi:hypothetical protein
MIILAMIALLTIFGSFPKVGTKSTSPYVAECQFKYNNRDNADIFGAAITGC